MVPKTPSDCLFYKDFHRNPALLVESGHGIYLNINDGRRILDATSGAAVACLGYSNREVQEAMILQMQDLSYCHPGFYKTEVAEELAELLVASTQGQMAKAALVGSGKHKHILPKAREGGEKKLTLNETGSEAVEVAIKLSKTFFAQQSPPQPSRDQFIARVGAWHGATLGALNFGDFKGRKDPFISLIPRNVSRVAACSEYRGKLKIESDEDYVRRLAEELEDEFQRIGPHRVCAFVAETVGGSVSSSLNLRERSIHLLQCPVYWLCYRNPGIFSSHASCV